MKKRFQNGLCLTGLLFLMFTLLPSGVLAVEPSNNSQTRQTEAIKTTNSLETQGTIVNVDYTSDFKDGFKVNSLTTERSGDYIVFTVNYVSSNDGGFSFYMLKIFSAVTELISLTVFILLIKLSMEEIIIRGVSPECSRLVQVFPNHR